MNDRSQSPQDAAPRGGADDRGPSEAPAIRLDDVLKLAGIAATGGQAKHLIQSGQVQVNGVVETRRKHLLVEGDEVAVGDEVFVVELAPDSAQDAGAGADQRAR